jgi:cytochrome c peroxidase
LPTTDDLSCADFLRTRLFALIAIALLIGLPGSSRADPAHDWSPAELAILGSLSLGNLPPLPAAPSNALADDSRAAHLGHRLFFDTRFSSNGQVACATCHQPTRAFTDGQVLGQGVGTATRNTMTIVGGAYSPWLFWDGRKDSLWSQALVPMENAAEHGGTRTRYAHLIAQDRHYRQAYEELFGPMPDISDASRFPPSAGPVGDPTLHQAWRAMQSVDRDAINRVFVNLGKSIAAYERRLQPGRSRFDWYVETLNSGDRRRATAILTDEEVTGLRLFIGTGQCVRCHNGPLFTNHSFHNTGTPDLTGKWKDRGRQSGVQELLGDEFNCLGKYSDAASAACVELNFLKTSDPHFERGFKTPTLRNVSKTAPYMHAGQFRTLAEVLTHYNVAPRQSVGRSELTPLGLSAIHLTQLEAFLRTLDSETHSPPHFLRPPPKHAN